MIPSMLRGRTATPSLPRPSFDHDFTRGTLPSPSTFTRAGSALYYTSQRLLAAAGAHAPRFSHDPRSGEATGLLMEEPVTAKNHYARPGAGTLAAHFTSTPAQLSIADDPQNPAQNLSNGTPVWALDNSAGGSAVTVSLAGATGNTAKHAIQIWARVIAGTGGSIDLGGSGSATISAAAWTLVESANITPPSSSALMRVTAQAGAHIQFTCANMQENIFSTTPIDTAGAAAARAAAKKAIPLGSWFNGGAGTFVLDHLQIGTTRRAAQVTLHAGTGSSSNRLQLGVNPDGGHALRCSSGGVHHVNSNVGNSIMADRKMIESFSYTASSFVAACNGSIVGRHANGGVPVSYSAGLLVGALNSGGAEYSGSFRRIAYYKTPLSEDQLRRTCRPPRPLGLSAAANEGLDLFLIAGQSNASGMAPLSGLPGYAHPSRLWLLGNDDVFKPYADPMDSDASQKDTTSSDAGTGFGFTGMLMDTLAGLRERNYGAVPCAKGSRAIDQWIPASTQDAALYSSLLRRAFVARHYGRLRAMIWYHGEQDATAGTSQADYTARLITFIARLRADLDAPDFPVLIVGLHDDPGDGRPSWAQIQAAQAALALPYTAHVTAAGCESLPGDPVHLSVAGHVTLAGRIAPVLAALIGD